MLEPSNCCCPPAKPGVYLTEITYPIHKYLFTGNHLKQSFIESGYRNELIERWPNEPTALQRHQKARAHEGKINELLCASWLENQGWNIVNLEALGGNCDIQATSPNNTTYAIEVKYIGQEDKNFKLFAESCLTHKATAGTYSIYDGYNFFLFKIYEAALQLQKRNENEKNIVFIVFSHSSLIFNSMYINENWIEQHPIEFLENSSDSWKNFLAKKKNETKYNHIENTLETYIKKLDEIWVIQQQSDLEYSLEKIIRLK